jgi:hypothetical protein
MQYAIAEVSHVVFLGDVMAASDGFRKVSLYDIPTVPRALAKLLLALLYKVRTLPKCVGSIRHIVKEPGETFHVLGLNIPQVLLGTRHHQPQPGQASSRWILRGLVGSCQTCCTR